MAVNRNSDRVGNAVLDLFAQAFEARYGPGFLRLASDLALAGQLAAVPADVITRTLDFFFSEDADPFYAKSGHDFRLFVSHFNKLRACSQYHEPEERSSVRGVEATERYLEAFRARRKASLKVHDGGKS